MALIPSLLIAADRPLVFYYQNLRPPGTVERQARIDELQLTVVTFANGVRLNVRPSATEPSHFRLRVVFPINATFSADFPMYAYGSAGTVFLSDLEHHPRREIEVLLTQHQIEVEIRVDQGTPRLTLHGPAASLPFALQLLTAWLSDPIDRLGLNVPRRSSNINFLPQDPSRLSIWRSLRLASGSDLRLGQPGVSRNTPFEFPMMVPLDERLDWINVHMMKAPLEVAVVGDLDVEQVISNAATSLGTLEKRIPLRRAGPPLKTANKSARLAEISPDFSSEIAMSCLLWPLTGPEEPRSTAAAEVAGAILRDALVATVTQVFQKTIEPKVWLYRDPVQRDFAFFVMQNAFTPATAGGLTEAIIRTAAKFADLGATEEQFNRVRGLVRKRRAAELEDNQWWLDNVLWAAQTHPELVAEGKNHLLALDSLNVTDVNQAAKLFTGQLCTAVILNGGRR